MRKSFKNNPSSSYEKKDYKREGKQVKEEYEPSRNLGKEKEKPWEGSSSHTHSSGIKCFKCLDRGHIESQCPTKKIMILRALSIIVAEMKNF